MRQRLIRYYREILLARGLDEIDATLRAMDDADTDIREFSQAELRVYVTRLKSGV